MVLNQEQFCTPEYIWQCLDIFLVVKNISRHIFWWGVGCISWVEATDAAKHPTRPRAAPPRQRVIQPKMLIVPRLRNPALAPPLITYRKEGFHGLSLLPIIWWVTVVPNLTLHCHVFSLNVETAFLSSTCSRKRYFKKLILAWAERPRRKAEYSCWEENGPFCLKITWWEFLVIKDDVPRE